MWLNISFFIFSCLANAIIRASLYRGITEKPKSGNKLFDWFLLGCRDKKRKIWIDLHLALSIVIPIAFILGIIGCFVEQVIFLNIVPMIVFFLSLCVCCVYLAIDYWFF